MELRELLAGQRPLLEAHVRRHGRGLLAYESVDDVVQGVYVRAIEADARKAFEYRGEEALRAWLTRIVRHHVVSRLRYWTAQRRQGGRLLRISVGSSSGGGFEPSAGGASPSSFAARRELYVLAARSLSLQLPRDRDILQWTSEGLTIDEIAAHLNITYAAAERARLRALGRFEKVLRLFVEEGDRRTG